MGACDGVHRLTYTSWLYPPTQTNFACPAITRSYGRQYWHPSFCLQTNRSSFRAREIILAYSRTCLVASSPDGNTTSRGALSRSRYQYAPPDIGLVCVWAASSI